MNAEFAQKVVRMARKGKVAVMIYPDQPAGLVCKPLELMRNRTLGIVGVYDGRATVGMVLADIEAAMEAAWRQE